MPRIKSSPRKCIKSKNGQSKTWVLMMENGALDGKGGADSATDLVRLRHPRSGQSAMFLFSPNNATVQEVFAFSERKRSWFIENSVKEDGQMHMSTPVDPAFLVLPYLKRSSQEGRVLPLEDLLVDATYPETSRLVQCPLGLHNVADRRGDEALNAWSYNEEKAVKWLRRKAEKVAEVLKEKRIQCGEGATSNAFVKSAKHEPQDSGDYLRYAHGLVSEYLTQDLSDKLLNTLGLPVEPRGEEKKRKTPMEPKADNVKKPRGEGSVLDLSHPLPAPKQPSAKDKPRSKAPAGTKSISSFFKKT